jgi:hypothetical protein
MADELPERLICWPVTRSSSESSITTQESNFDNDISSSFSTATTPEKELQQKIVPPDIPEEKFNTHRQPLDRGRLSSESWEYSNTVTRLAASVDVHDVNGPFFKPQNKPYDTSSFAAANLASNRTADGRPIDPLSRTYDRSQDIGTIEERLARKMLPRSKYRVPLETKGGMRLDREELINQQTKTVNNFRDND